MLLTLNRFRYQAYLIWELGRTQHTAELGYGAHPCRGHGIEFRCSREIFFQPKTQFLKLLVHCEDYFIHFMFPPQFTLYVFYICQT